MDIRLLRANEIECRVQSVKKDGCSVLLYKDARCDMKILDETFGTLGWEREHQEIHGKLFCTIKVWDEAHGRWVSKQDVGVESNTEAAKGEASDSFKRACFNLGIGRELYTAPFVWINFGPGDTKENNGKVYPKVTFRVKDIGYNDEREICYLVIEDNKGVVRWQQGTKSELIKCTECGKLAPKKITDRAIEVFGKPLCKECGLQAAAKQQEEAGKEEAAAGNKKQKAK